MIAAIDAASPYVARQRGLPKMQESAVDEFLRIAQRSMPSTNAEGARKPILFFFRSLCPPRAQPLPLIFAEIGTFRWRLSDQN
jgi:hypothetical protein